MYMVIEWEELFLSSETNSEITIESLDKNTEPKNFESLKKNLLNYVSLSELHTKTLEYYLKTDLSGKITPFSPQPDNRGEEAFLSLHSIVDDFLFFYKNNFKKDDDVLIFLTKELVSKKKFDELKDLIKNYKKNSNLPLTLEIYLIITDILPRALPNAILHGEEVDVLNILYKHKFFEISEAEKNVLYDKLVEERNLNLLGFVFHLYKDIINGVRNIYPLLEILYSFFHLLEIYEQKIFIDAYSKSGNLFKTFCLIKKFYNRKELITWIESQKKIYGKLRINKIQDSLEDKNKSELFLINKDISIFTPFDLYNALKIPFMNKILTEFVYDSIQKNPNSYIFNQAQGVVLFHKKEFFQTLKFLENSGSFKWSSESLFLKAICLQKIGYKKESDALLRTLKSYFPQSEELKKYI